MSTNILSLPFDVLHQISELVGVFNDVVKWLLIYFLKSFR